MSILTRQQRCFLERHRVARLATVDPMSRPHLVPICFVLSADDVYTSVDQKPKRDPGRALQRVRNIVANPAVALSVDTYDEDWSRLGWVMLRGRGEVLESGSEHDRAQALLGARYPQYGTMSIGRLPVIVLRIERAISWGRLD